MKGILHINVVFIRGLGVSGKELEQVMAKIRVGDKQKKNKEIVSGKCDSLGVFDYNHPHALDI